MMDRFELAVCLFIVAIGSFIAGGACVGIQFEKVKKQRDDALKRLEKK